MFFDFLENVKHPITNKPLSSPALMNICKNAERNSRVNPDNAIIDVRKAMEALLGELVEAKTDDVSLYDGIEMAFNSGIIDANQKNKLHKLRYKANKFVHITKNNEYVINDRHITVNDACYAVISLIVCVAGIFKVRIPKITYHDLPIGKYTVISKIEKDSDESIYGGYNYYCECKEEFPVLYAYIRPFKASADDEKHTFSSRDRMVQRINKSIDNSPYIASAEEIDTDSNCDISYLVYNVTKNTIPLDLAVQNESITPRDALLIAASVTQGLIDLKNEDFDVHHRNIKPKSIFICKSGSKTSAKLAFFETAKVVSSESAIETVTPYLQKNAFTHYSVSFDVVDDFKLDSKAWEHNDVYSIAKIICYCIEPINTLRNIDVSSKLYKYYSDEFVEKMSNILFSELLDIPDLEIFFEILKKELQNEW